MIFFSSISCDILLDNMNLLLAYFTVYGCSLVRFSYSLIKFEFWLFCDHFLVINKSNFGYSLMNFRSKMSRFLVTIWSKFESYFSKLESSHWSSFGWKSEIFCCNNFHFFVEFWSFFSNIFLVIFFYINVIILQNSVFFLKNSLSIIFSLTRLILDISC